MKYKISDGLNDDGTALNAKGGTEMVRDKLLEKIRPDLLQNVKIIHSRVREDSFEKGKKHILVLHDLWADPEAQHLKDPVSRRRFAKLVFVSHHQFAKYNIGLGVPFSESVVIQNGITPIKNIEKTYDDGNPIRLIYHTTPHRGLEILYPVFSYLHSKYGDKIHLDIFSSFNIYGWPQRDEPFKQLFETCKNHPGITYHGTQSNETVRDYLRKAHIFAYPSIWEETSCIAAIEAMSAGCEIVCSNYGALPETTANFATMYPFTENVQDHANVFANVLDKAIERQLDPLARQRIQNKLAAQKHYCDGFYDWKLRIQIWENLLEYLNG